MIAPTIEHAAGGSREIAIRVPRGLKAQLVFRQVFRQPLATTGDAQFDFQLCRGIRSYLVRYQAVGRALGLLGAVKGAAKASTKRRMFYFVREGRNVLHYGWATIGRCRHYRIEPGAAVIGPIWTSPQARGRGVATIATLQAIDALVRQGHSTIYIDTSQDNAACLKVIEKCGFGPPIAAFIRGKTL